MIASLLIASLMASSNAPDTAVVDSTKHTALVDTGKVMASPRRPVAMGIYKRRDSLAVSLNPNSAANNPIGSFIIGLRLKNEWVGGRMSIGEGLDSGVSYSLGYDYHNAADNQSFDSTFRTRTESKGFRLSLIREKCYPLFPRTSIIVDLGAAYRWQALYENFTTTSLSYNGIKSETVIRSSEWSKHFSLVLGVGARLHLSESLYLSGGVQFEPDWTKTTKHPSNAKNLSGSQFHLNTPDWNIGLDWDLSVSQGSDGVLVKK